MSTTQQVYENYRNKLQQIADVKYAAAVLQWDQETYLPVKGNEARGRQLATLTSIAHQLFTDTTTENLINELISSSELTDQQHKNIELSAYDFNKSKKLPSSFVRKSSEVINKSFHAWIAARKENDFKIFENPLQDVIDIKKQEADLLGYEAHPYDALMNEYDRGLTVKETDRLFTGLSPAISEILNNINQFPQLDNSFLYGHFDKKKQWDFGLYLLKAMHFDFEAGRQDISEHPFTTNFSSKDVRVTTRIDENDLANMVWSCIHEGGHALYEQGLPHEQYGLPLGEYCSLSIHESQSRIWENCIGRGLEFWKHHYPTLQSYFPDQLNTIDLGQFYRGINKVQPSLIRTEADELTYHFHIMIRYEIEKKLIEGSLNARDIPNVWNEMYQKNLNVKVPNDKEGCLQDVHWSHGSFGYFPTYSIGSLYAAQFWSNMNHKINDLKIEISSGNNLSVINWLQKNIFSFGRYHYSSELCKIATSEILNPSYFIQYAKDKFYDIYKK
jgi:carboxypeptidase Taq